MVQNNLKKLEKTFVNIIGAFLLVSIVIFTMLFFFIYTQTQKANEFNFKVQVSNANKTLQANLAAQLSIIANNPDFISYLFSGDISRQRHYGDIMWLFNNLDHKLVKGIIISRDNAYTGQNSPIFSYGKLSNFFTNLEVCYLNNRVDTALGDCVYKHFNLKIYFDHDAYLQQLNSLNPNIKPVNKINKLYTFNPFDKYFGIYPTKNYSTDNLELAVNSNNRINKFLIASSLSFILISALIFIISHKILQRLVDKKLVVPIKNTIESLHNNEKNQLNVSNIDELNELIDIVNKYNETQISNTLTKITARVAHDIKSPLSVIELSVANLIKESISTKKIIKNAVRHVRAIVDNMLLNYSGHTPINSEFDDTKVHVLIKDLIEEIIAQKRVEWSRQSNLFKLNYKFLDLNSEWVFLSSSEFKRHLSNLLNNSFEAKRLACVEIMVIVTIVNNFIKIQIIDNGIGIDKKLLPIIMAGGSLKDCGNGIGLESAVSYFKQAGGLFDINSEKNYGTSIDVYIPLSNPPSWFTDVIFIKEKLVIVDDDQSFIEYWQDKFKHTHIQVIWFTSPSEFINWYDSANLEDDVTFLIDFEYNHTTNGMELISKLKYPQSSFLITTNYYESRVQEQIIKLNAKIIPKSILSEISVIVQST